MNHLFKILFLSIFIFHCSSDAGSENILTDNSGDGSSNTDFNGGSNESTSELTVELVSTYNNQTASFSTLFDGFTRSFIVHTPPYFDYQNETLPLLFVLHGYTGRAPSIRDYSGFDQISDVERFIVVYVQGTSDIYGNAGWNAGSFGAFTTVDDVSFFKALIKYFTSNYNIDISKIFSAGMSMGGFMSYRLACDIENINSIGSVTGSMGAYTACNPQNKKSIIHFHGEDDNVVPYNGGDWLYSANAAHEFWKNHNNCNEQSSIILPDYNGDGQNTTKLRSYNCDDNTTVELYSLEGESHTWFKRSWGHDINSSELIWQFFKNQQ